MTIHQPPETLNEPVASLRRNGVKGCEKTRYNPVNRSPEEDPMK